MILSAERLLAAFDDNERQALFDIKQARDLVWPEPLHVTFSTSQLSEPALNRIETVLPRRSQREIKAKSVGYLYVFAQCKDCVLERADILRAITHAKGGGGTKDTMIKNLCALNLDAPEGRVLYVGRSWDPKARVLGHLRASTSGTYAVHFAAWAGHLDLKVDLFVYEFAGIQDRTLQVLEDVVWDFLLPLFGRRGRK